jgi:hypothetical protein
MSAGLRRGRYLGFLALLGAAACSSVPSSEHAGASSQAASTAPLSWVGNTALAYETAPPGGPVGPNDDVVVPSSFVVAANDLDVVTDTYPSGAATTVTLFWANAEYSSVASLTMTRTSTTDGPFGDNDRFVGTIPGSSLVGGAPLYYWIRADGANGESLYDSQNGANYSVVPRALSVGWAGDLGAYDAQGGPEFYRVGELFNSDLSTTVGCWENGPDDYQIQAVQVYVPGLTDQGYSGDLEIAAGHILQAQLWTDMTPNGWGPINTTCRAGIGNNYVCNVPLTVFPASTTSGCLVGGDVPAGTYEWKLRFSVDSGSTWYWVGSADGNGGGSNLSVYYAPSCPFAENDRAACTTTPTAP